MSEGVMPHISPPDLGRLDCTPDAHLTHCVFILLQPEGLLGSGTLAQVSVYVLQDGVRQPSLQPTQH